MNLYINREEVWHLSASICNTLIADNSYNLSVNSFVEHGDTHIDTNALNDEMKQMITHENEIREQINESVTELYDTIRC